MNCPKCNCSKSVKSGKVKERQRYKCKGCGCNYTVELKSTAKPKSQKEQALHLYLEGLGFRSIGRILGVSNALLISIFLFFSCSSNSDRNPSREKNNSESYYYSGEDDNEQSEDIDEYESYGSYCKFNDGTYSATVDYYNSRTGYSATYTLDVEVEDCQVVQINFPNGGWVDEDHIDYADLDENGFATVHGENGKQYEVQIDY